MRRVIRSLIHNAIKFSPDGQATEVELSRSAEWVTISVRDHGPGIPEEEQGKIFGLFSPTDSGTERATHGVGMGLPISKKIAQLHAGDLRYEDPGDGGAQFVLALPVGAEANSSSRQLSGA